MPRFQEGMQQQAGKEKNAQQRAEQATHRTRSKGTPLSMTLKPLVPRVNIDTALVASAADMTLFKRRRLTGAC